MCVCSSNSTALSTGRHPAHQVSVPILHPGERFSVVTNDRHRENTSYAHAILMKSVPDGRCLFRFSHPFYQHHSIIFVICKYLVLYILLFVLQLPPFRNSRSGVVHEILNLFFKNKRDQLLRAPSVRKRISMRIDEGRKSQNLLAMKRQGTNLWLGSGTRAWYMTPDLSYDCIIVGRREKRRTNIMTGMKEQKKKGSRDSFPPPSLL